MYTPKHIAEAMAELFDDPKWEGGMGATTIAWCNLWDRVASETGLSEEALMQLMKEGFLLRMEHKRQMGKVMRLLTGPIQQRSATERVLALKKTSRGVR
jgi:hypothetical protein